MRTRHLAAIATAALLVAGAAGCGDSEAESQEQCVSAIKARTEGDTAKPKACNGLSEEDYDTIVIGHVLEKEGLDEVDEHPEDLLDYGEDGDVDRDQ